MLNIGEMDFSSNSILPDLYHYWVHQSRIGVVNDDDDIDIAELIWASPIIDNDIGNVTGNIGIGHIQSTKYWYWWFDLSPAKY